MNKRNVFILQLINFITIMLLLFMTLFLKEKVNILEETKIKLIESNLATENKYEKSMQEKLELETIIINQNKEIIELTKQLENIMFNHVNDAEYFMEVIEPLKEIDKEQYFMLYKDIKEHYSDIIDNPESIYDYYTSSQINIMQRCIETETFGCGFDAKVNVASVILNRVDSNKYPSDPIKVVTSPNQFAYGRTHISETTKLALEYAFEIEDTTNGCVGFRSDIKPKKWNGLNYQFTDKVGHHFYKKGGEDK